MPHGTPSIRALFGVAAVFIFLSVPIALAFAGATTAIKHRHGAICWMEGDR